MALVEIVVGAPALYSCSIGVFVLVICYIFYPAYKCREGGLGCTETILAGDKSSAIDLTLVIPAYNEEERLPTMLNETLDYLDKNRESLTHLCDAVVGNKLRRNKSLIKYELIVVDDGSSDNTCNVLRKYAATLTSGDTVKLISMNQNVGKGGAVKTGMLRSLGQLCLMIDADGATDITDGLPKLLKEMHALMNKHRDNTTSPPTLAVFGSRAHLENESAASRSNVRTFLMHAFHFFVKALCSSRIKDTQCGFKLFTRSAAGSLFTNLHLRRWAFDTELVVIAEKLNISVSEVGVIWHEVDGSKLDGGKLSLALVSLGMLRDMLCVKACYFFRIWALKIHSK
ncbi:hypothetical protein ACHAXM_010258 [Skeletonema potamos]